MLVELIDPGFPVIIEDQHRRDHGGPQRQWGLRQGGRGPHHLDGEKGESRTNLTWGSCSNTSAKETGDIKSAVRVMDNVTTSLMS